MPALLSRLILAVVVAVIVTIACTLLGAILGDLHVEIASTIGGFLSRWATVLGLLAGLWFFFAGYTFGPRA